MLAEEYFEPPKIRFMQTWGPSFAPFETNLAIITACLPALRPLFRAWFPNVFVNSSNQESRAAEEQHDHTGIGSGNDRSIMMRDFSHQRGNARCGSNSTTESHEQLFKSAGIRRTTDVGHFS